MSNDGLITREQLHPDVFKDVMVQIGNIQESEIPGITNIVQAINQLFNYVEGNYNEKLQKIKQSIVDVLVANGISVNMGMTLDQLLSELVKLSLQPVAGDSIITEYFQQKGYHIWYKDAYYCIDADARTLQKMKTNSDNSVIYEDIGPLPITYSQDNWYFFNDKMYTLSKVSGTSTFYLYSIDLKTKTIDETDLKISSLSANMEFIQHEEDNNTPYCYFTTTGASQDEKCKLYKLNLTNKTSEEIASKPWMALKSHKLVYLNSSDNIYSIDIDYNINKWTIIKSNKSIEFENVNTDNLKPFTVVSTNLHRPSILTAFNGELFGVMGWLSGNLTDNPALKIFKINTDNNSCEKPFGSAYSDSNFIFSIGKSGVDISYKMGKNQHLVYVQNEDTITAKLVDKLAMLGSDVTDITTLNQALDAFENFKNVYLESGLDREIAKYSDVSPNTDPNSHTNYDMDVVVNLSSAQVPVRSVSAYCDGVNNSSLSMQATIFHIRNGVTLDSRNVSCVTNSTTPCKLDITDIKPGDVLRFRLYARGIQYPQKLMKCSLRGTFGI